VSEDRSFPTDADRHALAQRGVSEHEALRQLDRLRRPPSWTQLDRPCTAGDGIRRLTERDHESLLEAHRDAAAAGRFTKFVPSSGAATRMFRELLQSKMAATRDRPSQPGDDNAAVLTRFLDELERFAFFPELKSTLASRGHDVRALRSAGEFLPILEALLDSDGMDYDDLPKGRLSFHREAREVRTAFEEHLVEAARYVRSADGTCRLHFTVSQEHRAGFEALLERVGPGLARTLGTRWDLDWSHQQSSTDTLAVDTEGSPIRDTGGQLIFRPGGHGALIENIGRLDADLVYIKNIDNVQPEHIREATVLWKKFLGGLLAQTESRAHRLVRALGHDATDSNVMREARAFARETFAVEITPDETRESLLRLLRRPLRVAGVVPNTGEPGGGPFWVRAANGDVRAQIVETAQVDPGDNGQQTLLNESTHFNPVDLVCAVRGADGQPFDLAAYVDPDAAIVTRKSSAGRDVLALERPGLWNGAMAGWNTIFVEVPLDTFTPVKSVLDLLRPEHQPPG
jgi:hypothetical protein